MKDGRHEQFADWITRYYSSHKYIPDGNSDGELIGRLIRCKDCKHFKQSDAWDRIEMWCDYHHGDFDTWESLENDEGFCSWAEEMKHEAD